MEPLEEVCAHIDDVPYRGLTVEKIWDRGRVVEVTDEAIVFEVERHRSASGAMYREGLSMSAFVTYWPRYRYDRAAKTLTELEEERPREFECDYAMLADEMLEYGFDLRVTAEGDAWICEESASNQTAAVQDGDETKAFAERMVRDWDLEFLVSDLDEVLSKEKLDAHLARLKDALAMEARRQAQAAWERREDSIK